MYKVLPVDIRTPQEIERGFSDMSREKASAVIVFAEALFMQQQHQVAELALKYRLPSISSRSANLQAG